MCYKLVVLVLLTLAVGLVRPATGLANSASATNPAGGIRVGKVPLDLAAEQRLQLAVDGGHMPWRLDPIEVARADGQELGFVDADRFEMIRPLAPGEPAVVRVAHADLVFEIRLVQPVRAGIDGIWAIDEVRAIDSGPPRCSRSAGRGGRDGYAAFTGGNQRVISGVLR